MREANQPWIFLALVVFFGLVVTQALRTPTQASIPAIQGALAAAPRVIDHRVAWTPALKDSPARSVEGDLVYVRNGHYVFEDGSYVTDSQGNPVPATLSTPTGMAVENGFRNADYYQPKLLRFRYVPVLESCEDSDDTRASILRDPVIEEHNSYFKPGIVTLSLVRERVIGETAISREIVNRVELQDRCFSAQDLGFTNLPENRGVVLEANCAALKGLKTPAVTDALANALYQDTGFNGDLSLLNLFYTAQFCQKSEPTYTRGSIEQPVIVGGCGHEGRQGFCL